MSRMRKVVKQICVGVSFCFLMGLIVMGTSVKAGAKTADSPGIACKTGKYIYFACNSKDKHKSGIMRYDTKSGKKKLIVDNWVNGKVGNGFYHLTVKGNYIYATWNRGSSSYKDATYIYRFSKNGKKKKKIAVGRCPVVAGKYLYYIEGKISKTNTLDTGNVCRVKLNGTGKKKVIKKKGQWFFQNLYSYGDTFLYSSSDSEDSLFTKAGKAKTKAKLQINENNFFRDSNCEYYSNETAERPADTVYRKYFKDEKEEVVAQYEKSVTFRVCGDYMIIQTVENSNSVIYCMEIATGKKVRLAKWTPEE